MVILLPRNYRDGNRTFLVSPLMHLQTFEHPYRTGHRHMLEVRLRHLEVEGAGTLFHLLRLEVPACHTVKIVISSAVTARVL